MANVEVKPQYRRPFKWSADSPEDAAKASFSLEEDSSVRVYEVVNMETSRCTYLECGKQVYVKQVGLESYEDLHNSHP